MARANDELKTLDQLKTVFMEIVSHELNTPTAIILGYSSLLKREQTLADPKATGQSVTGIHTSGKRLKRIISKISKMMAADLRAIELALEPIDASEVLHEIVDELQAAIDDRKQSVEIELGGPDIRFSAERAYIRDMLMNLVVNAIKFSPDGSTIWLGAYPARLGRRHAVEFRVRDEGVGIRPEDRDQIFTSFFGTFDSRHHSSGDFGFEQRGIGLGLAIVKRFAEMHGGEVSFDSELGSGTEFRVTIPVEPRHATAELPSISSESFPAIID